MMRRKGVIVLLVQMALVLSIAAKYAWERHACPMVWTRATQYDPSQPLRGRYLALNLRASACGLSAGDPGSEFGWNARYEWNSNQAQTWRVQTVARDGQLAAKVAKEDHSQDASELTLRRDLPCEAGLLGSQTEFFIAEHAQTPFPLQQGQELWALVTVPPSGPPRPVRLAVSDAKGFRVLDLQ